MSSHIEQALEFFKDNGFVSEDDVNSIGTSIFRRSFEEYLDQNNLKYLDAAEEMADGWYYYFYNPN